MSVVAGSLRKGTWAVLSPPDGFPGPVTPRCRRDGLRSALKPPGGTVVAPRATLAHRARGATGTKGSEGGVFDWVAATSLAGGLLSAVIFLPGVFLMLARGKRWWRSF